jgi:hypothetical protein
MAITQMTLGGWKAPSTIPPEAISELRHRRPRAIQTTDPDKSRRCSLGWIRRGPGVRQPPLRCRPGRCRALGGQAPPEAIPGAVLPHRFTGDQGRLSARAAALHPLARSEPPPLASAGAGSLRSWMTGCPSCGNKLRHGSLMPRSFNRRISAVSALYRWASEPTRSAVSGVPRNPIPRRTGMSAPKLAKPLAESDLTSVFGVSVPQR